METSSDFYLTVLLEESKDAILSSNDMPYCFCTSGKLTKFTVKSKSDVIMNTIRIQVDEVK